MQLTGDEIKKWKVLIPNIENIELIRKFYMRIDEQDKLKEILRKDAQISAKYSWPDHLQSKVDNGLYQPELDSTELLTIISEIIDLEIIEDGPNVALSLEYPVFQQAVDVDLVSEWINGKFQRIQDQMSLEKAIDMMFTGEPLGDGEIEQTYELVKNPYLKELAKPELVKAVVSSYVFEKLKDHQLDEAKKAKDTNEQFYEKDIVKELFDKHIGTGESIADNYMAQCVQLYVEVSRSEFRSLLPSNSKEECILRKEKFERCIELLATRDVFSWMAGDFDDGEFSGVYNSIVLGEEILDYLDGKSSYLSDEAGKIVTNFTSQELKEEYVLRQGLAEKVPASVRLHGVIGLATDEFGGVIDSILELNDILDDPDLGDLDEENIRQIFQLKIQDLINSGHASSIYDMKYGLGGELKVHKFNQYTNVNDIELFEKMVEEIPWSINGLLMDYSFEGDSLDLSGYKINCVSYLLKKIRNENQPQPSKESISKSLFLDMAVSIKNNWGNYLQEVIDIYENPENAEYIDDNAVRTMLNKVFDEYFDKVRTGGMFEKGVVSYFYKLTGSSLGELVKDDERLQPYFMLHKFLED